MNERQTNKEQRYNEILITGLDLLVENGYKAFKIRDLAKRLNISTGLFFHYFKSKEDLYNTLVNIGLKAPTDLIGKNTKTEDVLNAFTNMASQIFKYIEADSFTAKMFILMHQTTLSGDVPDTIKETFTEYNLIDPLIPLIKKGQSQNVIKQGDPITLVLTYWSAINGIAEMYVKGACKVLPEGNWISDILKK